MNTVTLDRAARVADALNGYAGEPSYDKLVAHVKKKMKTTTQEVTLVVRFLQDVGVVELKKAKPGVNLEIMDGDIDLEHELTYNYKIAKALLDHITKSATLPDGEEIRKTLRELSRFSEAMLKMQERVTNLKQMQEFQARVVEIVADYPDIVQKIIDEL